MRKPRTDRSSQRSFAWGIRSTDLAIVQALSAAEPLAGTADCTGGCASAHPADPKRKAPARRAQPR